jgi:dUTP pyrophosphatase
MATNNEVNTNAQVPKVVIIKAGLEAIIPTKGSASAAGYDLYTPTDFTLAPGQQVTVDTGIVFIMPPNIYGEVRPRSGLAFHHNIIVLAGVIDNDYRGAVKVILYKLPCTYIAATSLSSAFTTTSGVNATAHVFKAGDRIAQIIFKKSTEIDIIEASSENLLAASSATERGTKGFGSTGK